MKISAKDMSGTFLIILWYESEDEKLSLETFKSNWHEIIHTSLFSCQHMLNENIQSKCRRILTVWQISRRADHLKLDSLAKVKLKCLFLYWIYFHYQDETYKCINKAWQFAKASTQQFTTVFLKLTYLVNVELNCLQNQTSILDRQANSVSV